MFPFFPPKCSPLGLWGEGGGELQPFLFLNKQGFKGFKDEMPDSSIDASSWILQSGPCLAGVMAAAWDSSSWRGSLADYWIYGGTGRPDQAALSSTPAGNQF